MLCLMIVIRRFLLWLLRRLLLLRTRLRLGRRLDRAWLLELSLRLGLSLRRCRHRVGRLRRCLSGRRLRMRLRGTGRRRAGLATLLGRGRRQAAAIGDHGCRAIAGARTGAAGRHVLMHRLAG
jgi:hypothetical protein